MYIVTLTTGHKYVDCRNGFVYIPYTTNWISSNSLIKLIHKLQVAFSELPPVFSKKKKVELSKMKVLEDTTPISIKETINNTFSKITIPPKNTEKNLENSQLIKTIIKKINSKTEYLLKTKKNHENYNNIENKRKQYIKRNEELCNLKNSYIQQIQNLKISIQEDEQTLQKYQTIDPSSIDYTNIIIPEEGIYDQLFESQCKIHSYEDSLFFLDRCLAKECVDIKEYVKQLRKISRNLYSEHVLSQKITKILEETL